MKIMNLARLAPFVLLVVTGIQSTPEAAARAQTTEHPVQRRTLEILGYGYQLPVQIAAVRHFQAEHWMRDLEIDVKNISGRPIFEVDLALFFPDDRDSANNVYGVNLSYGRPELMDPGRRPLPDDKPIGPGEAVVLKVDDRLANGYEQHLLSGTVDESASRRVRIAVMAVNFGDGTGFINGGVPYPPHGNLRARERYMRVPVD